MTWELRSRVGVISRHSSEQLAWAAYRREMQRISKLLNRPGLHGGIDAPTYAGFYVVRVSDVA